MAPLVSDPRQLQVVLNPARRKALYTLISDITLYMRQQLQLPDPPPPSASRTSSAAPPDDAPLFQTRSSDTSSPDASPTHHQEPHRARPASPPPPPTELTRLNRAALAHFDAWRRDVLTKLKDLLSRPDDNQTLAERRRRLDRLASTAADGESLIDLGGPEAAAQDGAEAEAEARAREEEEAVSRLQALYHPIPTRLTTIPVQDRKEAVSAVLLVLLSAGNYPAESRTLAVYLTSALELPLAALVAEETEIAVGLVERSADSAAGGMSADAEAQKRREEGRVGRYWKVGLASVAGAAVIGVTGGLAAPVVAGAIGGLMGTVGLGGVASFLGIFWMNGALVGTLFGAFGARMTGEIVDQYAREVEDFRFIPLGEEWGPECARSAAQKDKMRRLRVTIGVNGWLTSKEDVTKPWRALGADAEVFALRYEMDRLLELGRCLHGLVSSYVWSAVRAELLRRTVLATLWSALWPAYLLSSAATGIDNPFSRAKNRSEKAGRILADALINKVQGERPVTLVGYSLGARAIYACLRTLAERRAFGLVESVVFVGAPVPSSPDHWRLMRAVVSGPIFNVYSANDSVLAFLYRATSVQLGVAGLQPVRGVDGVENLDLTAEVQGHLRYPDLIGNILVRCGFPDVVGTDGSIQQDADDDDDGDRIRLRDADLGQTGTLIDLDDLTISGPERPRTPPLTKAHTTGPESLWQMQTQTRPTASRSKSEAVASEGANTKYLGTVRDMAVPRGNSPPPPAYTPSASGHGPSATTGSQAGHQGVVRHEDDSDDEEDGYTGITMVDNDEDDGFAHVEPIPLED